MRMRYKQGAQIQEFVSEGQHHHHDQKRGRGDAEGGSRTVRHRLEFLPKPTKDHGIGHGLPAGLDGRGGGGADPEELSGNIL